ncbi:MAG TPA: hypothetical protein VF192_13375 [Longimicrobiales bacterium]
MRGHYTGARGVDPGGGVVVLGREGRAASRLKEWVSLVRERRAAQAARWFGRSETGRDRRLTPPRGLP